MKNWVFYILMVTFILAVVCGVILYLGNQNNNETIIVHTIEKEVPIFRMASYQINYFGRIYKNGTDTIFLNIPTGGYSVRFDYEAIVLIGTKQHPRVTLIDNVINLDFSDVRLEVIAVTPTSLELVRANTSGMRWFLGSGIPIQAGLFEPFIDTINTLPEVLNEDERIQELALVSLINSFKEFYSLLNYEIEVNL